MGIKVRVIGIGEGGIPKTHEVTEKEVEGKCKKKYGSKLWVDRDRNEKNV